jgi:hypothetical protein
MEDSSFPYLVFLSPRASIGKGNQKAGHCEALQQVGNRLLVATRGLFLENKAETRAGTRRHDAAYL